MAITKSEDAWLGVMIVKEQKRKAKADKKAKRKGKAKKLRKKHPALKEAYDRYKFLLALLREHE